MPRSVIERKLTEVGARLEELRRELVVSEQQLVQLVDEADDARLRALITENRLAEKESRNAQKHAEAMTRHRAKVKSEITQLEQTQDDLLDRLTAGS
jgi:regulator of replication initiation timing